MWSAAMDVMHWGALGTAALCSLLCLASCAVLVIALVWRTSKRTAAKPEARPALPVAPLESPAVLTGPLGYVRTGEVEYSRERWGRPLTYRCTLAEGAVWQSDAFGRRICIREHTIRADPPSGLSRFETGDDAIDLRYATFSESAEDARLIADPELRARLLAVPWLQVVADGETVQMRDPERRAEAEAVAGLPDGPAATAAKVQLHDCVGDVLVMLADRLS